MDVHHPVHHGEHRRRRRHRRILVVGLSLLVLAGGIVAALAWSSGPSSSNGQQAGGPAPSAAMEHGEHTSAEGTTRVRHRRAWRPPGLVPWSPSARRRTTWRCHPTGIDTVPLTNLGGWLLAGLVLKTLLEAVIT